MKNRDLLVSMVALLVLAASPARSGESVYTDIDLDHCTTLEKGAEDEPGADYISLSCKGYGDYALLFKEGDLRQAAYFGYLDQKIVDDAFESFGPFNHIGKKIEWRIGPDGRPYAAILRRFIENSNDAEGAPPSANDGQVLVIARVGQPEDRRGCVVGYVDALANRDANEQARKVADGLAADFKCGKDRPVFHGDRGKNAAEPL